jgi:hypothetical protein
MNRRISDIAASLKIQYPRVKVEYGTVEGVCHPQKEISAVG